MSATVLLRVTCERCGAVDTVEPVPDALRHARQINANASPQGLELYKLTKRPEGWGRVEWARADSHGKASREVCAGCLDAIEQVIQEPKP